MKKGEKAVPHLMTFWRPPGAVLMGLHLIMHRTPTPNPNHRPNPNPSPLVRYSPLPDPIR